MAKSLKLMFVPNGLGGHINSSLGLAHVLKQRGHQITFAVRVGHKSMCEKNGMNVLVIDNPIWKDDQDCGEYEAQLMKLYEPNKPLDYSNVLGNLYAWANFGTQVNVNWFNKDYQLKHIVAEHKPDILLIDDINTYPSLIYSGIPWVWLFSPNPLGFYQDDNLITPMSGLKSDAQGLDVMAMKLIYKSLTLSVTNLYKLYFALRGYPANPENRLFPNSPYLNIYGFPKELDYNGVIPYANTFRVDNWFMPDMDAKQELNPDLKKFIDDSVGHKLLYVAMGSIASADLSLMTKLVDILSHSEHRYIIVKGYNDSKYDLPANMWGGKYLPQKQIIPLVDALITHGGTNTNIEAFTYGKPSVMFPAFLDHPDNAQRFDELGYGIRLDIHNISQSTLFPAIDRVLNDTSMKQRLNIASKRMLSSDSLQTAANLIENLQLFN